MKYSTTSIARVAAFTLVALFSTAGLSYAYLTDSAVYVPQNYNTFNPPAAGSSYVDPAFGNTVKRISAARSLASSATNGILEMVTNEYATMSPFNMDNTRLILQHDSYFGLYGGNGSFIKDLPFAVNAGAEPRWSKLDPAILYFINGNQLKQIDVNSGAVSVVKTFPEYGVISGKGESDISEDGKHFVFAGDNRYIFTFDISTGAKSPVFDSAGRGFDSLYITPNNNVTITWYSNGTSRFNGIEFYDSNMNFLRQVARVGGHMDIARDVNGDEVLVWANAADPQPVCNNGIVKIRLADAHQTCLIELDWALATHTSAPDNNGWVFVETYAPSNPSPTGSWPRFTNEILQIKLDGSEIRRVVHHRSRPSDSYYYMPKVASSHDGKKIVFASNMGLQTTLGYPSRYVDAYMIDIEPNAAPSPAPAPAPAPALAPVPAPTGAATRVEQNASSVALSGEWLPNNMAAHSGSSALLSTVAGSKATFSFSGTAAKWIAYTDEWSGIARVYVDGSLRGQVDTYSAPSAAQRVAYEVAGLAPGPHTLTVEATGTKSASSGGAWVWVDAFEAINTAPAPAPVPAPAPAPAPSPTGVTFRAEQNASSVTLSGEWFPNNMAAHSGSSALLSAAAGSKATFSFNGTAAKWIAYTDEWSGIARVYVDGSLLGQVDTYNAPGAAQRVAYAVSGLSAGAHTLTVEVTGTKSASSGGAWVWVDAFETTNTASAPAPVTVSTPAPVTTRIEQNNSAVGYSGAWPTNSMSAHSGGKAVLAGDAGARATLTFTGTGVKWIGYRDEWSGIAKVILDGNVIANVDTYMAPSRSQAVTYALSGLANTTHTLVIEVTGQKNASSGGRWVWVDAFDVTK